MNSSSTQDYYPFGMLMPGRGYSSSSYRFGFNGKEKDPETISGGGPTYDYGFRIYHPGIAKFLSVDPLRTSYPWYTPYQFAGNKPLVAIDLDGLEEFMMIYYNVRGRDGQVHLYKVDWKYIPAGSRFDNTPGMVYAETRDYNPGHEKDSKKAFKEQEEIGRTFFQNRQENIMDLTNDPLYNRLSNDRKSGGWKGFWTYYVKFTVKFGPDEGNTFEEVASKIVANNHNDDFLKIAAVLNSDPNAVIKITGSASKVPTNIDDTQPTTSEENNEELANQRAEAAKDYLLNLYRITYNQELNPNRIRTATTPAGGTPTESSAEGNENQKITVEIVK